MALFRYTPKRLNALLMCHLPLIFGMTVLNFSLSVSNAPQMHTHLLAVIEVIGYSPLLLLLLSKFPLKSQEGLRLELITPPLITGLVLIMQVKELYTLLTGTKTYNSGFNLQGVMIPFLILGESLPDLKSVLKKSYKIGNWPELTLLALGLLLTGLSLPEFQKSNPQIIYIFSVICAVVLSAIGIALFYLSRYVGENSKMLSILLYYCIQSVVLSFIIPAFDSQINSSILFLGVVLALAVDSVFLRPEALIDNGFSLSAANRRLRDAYEKRLTDSANLATATLNSLSGQICILNAEGNLTSVNRAWRDSALKSASDDPQEFLGRNYLEVCQSGVLRHSAQHIGTSVIRVLSGELNESAITYPSVSERGIKWFHCRISCFESSKGRCVVVAHEDITGLKAAEEELLLKSAAIERANDGIVLADPSSPDYPVVYASPGFLKLTGYTLEEVLGRNCRFLQGPDTDPKTISEIRDALVLEQPFTGDIINYKKNGEIWVNRLRLEPVRDENGKLLRYLGVQQNVTEQIKLEAERKKLLQKEREARLETEKHFQEAKAANALKDEFLATLSHELRTPAGVIGGFVELLKYENLSDDEQKEALDAIERNSRSLVTLIDDILDVSRVITGKFKLNPKPVDLTTVVESVISAEILAAQTKNIRIVTEFEPSLGPVYGDTTRLQQIFWNLLSNAIKFTPRNGRVKVTMETSGSRALVRIADTGVGIDPKFLPHVFERFRQQDSGMNRAYGGLGLGLSIVKHLVELHGGTVWAESRGAGRGSVFTVSLPILTASG
jgi:PAS domain S-box-containing protein